MSLFLEESSWLWDAGDRAGYVERIELLLDEVDIAYERDEAVAASHELLAQNLDGESLSDLVWGLPREVVERLSALFGRIRYWDDDEPWDVIEATIAGEEVVSPSAVHVHRRVCDGEVAGCIPLPGRWAGPTSVVVGEEAALVHFVTDEATHRGFFRAAMVAQKLDERAVEALASHAFPETFFLDDTWRGVRSFDGGYARVRDDLLRFLAVVDDHGAWIFTDTSGRLSPKEQVSSTGKEVPITDAIVEARFGGFGLNVAPEKPNVRRHAESRRARTRTVAGEEIYCEWHFKIERHTNRVHFHRPTEGSGGRVIVAIFAQHLPLPGD